ncbi:hypothetical protein BE21_49925 [Sorangium cellulosum]|uniref:eCIS core domain-containing protein n=1 Tax=Sorangium cellulosum TaxID=56 RepID=A0A150TGJ3_SORCE|nr:hypothetical protein BE21_49925 [Sorangium cellulosum]
MVRDAALGGVANASQPLPHLERIQSSFGRHDVTHVRAQIGARADQAGARMGALAYTVGDRIGFRAYPDVKLAAHEAAHVVQQRSGAKLPGGVGQPGDVYERHADKVADAVERGQSAEPVLDLMEGGGPSGAAPATRRELPADAPRPSEPPPIVTRGAGSSARSPGQATTHDRSMEPHLPLARELAPVAEQPGGAGSALRAHGIATAPPERPAREAGPPSTKAVGPAPPEPSRAPAADRAAREAKTPGRAGGKAPAATAASLSRIAAAPASTLKNAAQAEAQSILDDSAASEARLMQIGAGRRQRASAFFAGQRESLATFFDGAVAGVEIARGEAQARITEAAGGILESAHALIAGVVTAAEAARQSIRSTIDTIAASVTSAAQSTVDATTGRLFDLIDSMPLPDFLRGPAVSLLQGAASVLSDGLTTVVELVRSAIATGVSLIESTVSALAQAAGQALTFAVSGVESILQEILGVLAQIAAESIAALERALFGVLEPMLVRMEAMIVDALDEGERLVTEQVRENRDRHLAALASAVDPEPAEEGTTAQTSTPDGELEPIRAIGADAVRVDRNLVDAFDTATSQGSSSMIQAIVGAVGQVPPMMTAAVEAALRALESAATGALASIDQVAGEVTAFASGLLPWLAGELSGVVVFVRSLMQSPADALSRFAGNAWSRLRSFLSSPLSADVSAASTILGLFVPGALPDPFVPEAIPLLLRGPTPIPVPVPVPAPVLDLILTALLALLALLILLLLLYLLYLLIEWVIEEIRRRRRPCTISTKTLVSAPDGTADARRIVGVDERVELTCSSPATWTASCGRVSPAAGTTTEWTAPERGASCTITAAPALGASCSVEIQVMLPTGETPRFLGWHVGGRSTQGRWGGTLLPLSVSFMGTKVKEVDPGGAVDGCHFPGAKVRPGTGVTGGDWDVKAGNEWEIDFIGWASHEVQYYRTCGRIPCGFLFPQSMQMIRPGGDVEYARHNLGQDIMATEITSMRAGQTESKPWITRPWPFPCP